MKHLPLLLAAALVLTAPTVFAQINITNGADIDMEGSTGSQIIFPDGSTMDTAPDLSPPAGHGGTGNTVSGNNAFVGGGSVNTASGEDSTVSGGHANTASATRSTIGGGSNNVVNGNYATVSGGDGNTASDYAAVGGGFHNTASGSFTFVGAGSSNEAVATGATISGGAFNDATDQYGTVAGGASNQAGNGTASDMDARFATIGGGSQNVASGGYSTIAGGNLNVASGFQATVSGGYYNSASGTGAAVAGGEFNTAAGDYSFAAGRHANIGADHDGSFMFADQAGVFFESAAANEFAVRAHGGVRFVTVVDFSGTPTTTVSNAPNGDITTPGTVSEGSDRDSKENFEPVDAADILGRVLDLPITKWNYKHQDKSVRHIGTMAQDFAAAFNVGIDDKHIANIDANGVALAAIQGLHRELIEERQRNDELEARLSALESKLAD